MGYVSSHEIKSGLDVICLQYSSEFADMFPNASVVGTDLAPIQPSWVPPNLEL